MFGKVVFDDGEWMRYLCGLCHDAVHEWISYILKEGRKPNPDTGELFYKEAMQATYWYYKALASKES